MTWLLGEWLNEQSQWNSITRYIADAALEFFIDDRFLLLSPSYRGIIEDAH
jgi:hypothetical protein